MRYSQFCPECKQYGIKRRSNPVVEKTYKVGDEIFIDIFYSACGHTVIQKRSYQRNPTSDGYLLVHGSKVFSDGIRRNAYVPEHRFVWEQAHGDIPKEYVIHHINGIKTDNRLENLVALPRISHNNHMKQSVPVDIFCPKCNHKFSIIKKSKTEYTII